MNFVQVVESLLVEKDQSKKLKRYPVVVPPTSKKECIDVLLSDKTMSEGPWATNVKGKTVEMTAEEAFKKMDLNTLRHEALHALQLKQIPGIFKNLPKLSHQFDSPEDYKKKHYYNRPPEIMAYAYDSCMGVNTRSSDKTFKEIGGDVYDLYLHYKEEYKKVL